MNHIKNILLLLSLLAIALKLNAQEIYVGKYKAIFSSQPQNVPTPKTPDAPLAGNGDIGLTMGGTPDKLRFYLGKNDFWRAYPVYPGGGIAFPGGFDLIIEALKGADYYAEQVQDKAFVAGKFTKGDHLVTLKSWVSATTNTVIAELSSNKSCQVKFNLWAATGNTSITTRGETNGINWVSRSFENTPT